MDIYTTYTMYKDLKFLVSLFTGIWKGGGAISSINIVSAAIHHSEVSSLVGNICDERLTLFIRQDDVTLCTQFTVYVLCQGFPTDAPLHFSVP
jgi:hypothetical protein